MGGDLLLQTPTQPTGVLTALESLARPETTALRIAAAYTTLGGATTLMPRLADRIGAARWAGMPKLVVTSRDYGLTEPKAVEYLRAEQGVEVRFSSTPPSFHPKLFAFDSTLGLDVLVGSANLTRAALTTNTEAVALTSIRGDRAPFEAIWRRLLADSVAVDDALLAEYAAGWRKAPKPVAPDPPPPKTPKAPVGGLPVFGPVVADGRVDPARFDHFWVEAGSMSSGGSRTQLELPREAHRFFGFAISSYDDAHQTLGIPPLVSGGRRWVDRPLTWHGNNRMERINLPSVDKHGFSYPGAAILFRRGGSEFQLLVAPWDSDVANSWRAASRKAGREYRLGIRSPRTCGLF